MWIQLVKWDPVRIKVLDELRNNNINPYPHKFYFSHTIEQIRKMYGNKKKEESEYITENISTVGRIANIRRQGKASFVDIFDEGEKLQLYLRVNELGEKYELFFKYFSRGDIIGVEGKLFFTQRGELTLLVQQYTMLAKSLIEPPDWSKLSPEFRYAHRYVDFLYNSNSRKNMLIRFSVIKAIRDLLAEKGFMEVETPILQPVYGGALAKPFTTKVNFFDETWYLRISLELYLKRYIIGGFNKVFEIGKVFRNEDIDVTHSPEFTMLELYWAYADYNDIMSLTEEMLHAIFQKHVKSESVKYTVGDKQYEINLSVPFRRLPMDSAVSDVLGYDVNTAREDKLIAELQKYSLVPRGGVYSRGLIIEKLFDKLVVPTLIQPTFIIDHPLETTPLCKPHRTKEGKIERFELFIGSMEIANAYTELNDPILQDKLFKEEVERYKKGDKEAHPYDVDFIRALGYGMPPTGGLGVGVDRIVMLISNNTSIKEVIPFPMLSAKIIEED
ncbi:lysine--tRNA ligase [Sulfolobales archaeon HS-7]|nr:lysine--tRNA ligase [Sulfolobales archaeon HS-7]